MELETNIPPRMDIEAENQFSLQRVPSELSQKHTLHMFCKKFSNFSIEESIIFNWKNPLSPPIFSHDCKRYFEHYAILLVYSKNKLRLYNIRKFYEVPKMNEQPKENYELHLINEFNFAGVIQKILLHERFDQTFLVVALAESKISTLSFDHETNSLKTISMHSFENVETNRIREGRTVYHKANILKKDPYNRCVGYLIYESILVLLVSKELFPFLGLDPPTSAYTINVSMDDTWKEKDLFGPSIYFELKQSGIYSPVDFDFLWNLQIVSFSVLNERMIGELGTTKELYLFKINVNDFKKREFKKSEKPQEATKIYERYQNYMKYVNLAPDCYKIASLMNGGLLVISPFLIYYCFSKNQYILSLKPLEYIANAYKSLIPKESLYQNSELLLGPGLVNVNIEVLSDCFLLLSTTNDLFLLQLIFEENRNLKEMKLKRLNAFQGREIDFHSFCYYKLNSQKDRFTGIIFVNSKSGVSSLIHLTLNNCMESASIQTQFLDEVISFPAFYDLNIIEKGQSNIDKFITCGGVNMKSALYIFKKEITPQIIIDSYIDDEVETIFTIKNDEKEIIYHHFIILSLKNGASKVLYFENFQLTEEGEFSFLNEATIFCKRIKLGFENSSRYCNFVLQATKKQVRLLDLNGKLHIDLYRSEDKEIIQLLYFENTIYVLHSNFSLLAINIGWKPQILASLYELPILLSSDCIEHVCVNFEQNIELSKEYDAINFITSISVLNLKVSLNEQLAPQKYLVVCFSDGKLCFYNMFNEVKRLKPHRVFLCYNANEGLPYLVNSMNSHVDRSITDPNYKLKIPLAKKTNVRLIEEVKTHHLNKTLVLIIRIDNNEFFVYRGMITLDQNNSFLIVFSRVKINVSLNVQSNLEVFDQAFRGPFIEKEASNFFVPQNLPIKQGICKHKYSKNIQAIFVYNCPKPFAIFEKNGEIFSHPVNLSLNKENFCPFEAFAKFTYPEPLNDPTAKGFICLIQKTLVFCKLAYADYDQLKIQEDYNSFDYRSPFPFISIIFHDKVIDKFDILEYEKKKLMFLSVYKLMHDKNGNNETRRFELLLLDSENYGIKTKYSFNENESVISLKKLNISDNNTLVIGVALGIYVENDDQILINSKLVILEINQHHNFFLKNEITISEDLISDFFSLNSNIFLCIGPQISAYEWLSTKPYHTCLTEKTLFVSSTLIKEKLVNCGDIRKGFVCFFLDQYYENNKVRYKLIQRCQESLTAMSVMHNELFFFEGTLRVITSDPMMNNIGMYKLADDKKGFEKIGDFCTAYRFNKFLKYTHLNMKDNIEIFYCSDEGYIGSIVPLSGNLDNKLLINLYYEICEKIPFVAGLNPKEFRNPKKSQNEYIRAKKNIIDLQLLSTYCFLTLSLQKKISLNLGTTREYLLSLILHLNKLCS